MEIIFTFNFMALSSFEVPGFSPTIKKLSLADTPLTNLPPWASILFSRVSQLKSPKVPVYKNVLPCNASDSITTGASSVSIFKPAARNRSIKVRFSVSAK